MMFGTAFGRFPPAVRKKGAGLAFLLSILLLGFMSCPVAAHAAAHHSPAAWADVLRTSGGWRVDFRFKQASPVWVFARSPLASDTHQSWRATSWTIETPGVRLERHGRYDMLVSADGGPVPAQVRVAFTPFRGDVEASYNPALVFTDGSVALYGAQFAAFPVASVAGAESLPVDLDQAGIDPISVRTILHDSTATVLYRGRRAAMVLLDYDASDTYVMFGRIRPIVTNRLLTIIDRDLPGWLRDSLGRMVPALLARYTEAMGPPAGPSPMVLVNWRGPNPKWVAMTGSVLPGQVTLSFEGEKLLTPDPGVTARNLWFIAHEAAHFWLGQTIRPSSKHDSWITEGGADLLAVRAVAAIDPGFDRRAELQREVDDCVTLSAGGPVATALERDAFRAYYACGAVFGLVAEAASHRPFSDFVRGLIAANRASGAVDRVKWLAALDRVSGDPSLSADIAALLDRGAADPKAAIASLFRRSGAAFHLSGNGMPQVE